MLGDRPPTRDSQRQGRKTNPGPGSGNRELTRLPANFRQKAPEIRWQSRQSPGGRCKMKRLSKPMNTVMENLEPQSLWRHFESLSAIPRASEKEEAARSYVLAQA